MNVFISYSVQDTELVEQIAALLRPAADKVFWWGKDKKLGQELWDSIFKQIDQCDVVLAVVTDNAVRRGMSMGTEIGHAKKGGKVIIPLVAPDVKDADLSFLAGITYQQIDRNNPGPAMTAVRQAIMRIRFEGQKNLVVAAASVIALIYLFSTDKAA